MFDDVDVVTLMFHLFRLDLMEKHGFHGNNVEDKCFQGMTSKSKL